MDKTESMRRDWDARAAKDAFFYIATWRKDWDVSDFFKSGEEDYQRLVAPVLDRFEFAPPGKRALELGCGAGRMTSAFAKRFDHVTAVDISAEMLDRARQLLPDVENVTWKHSNGADLGDTKDASLDFVFTYLVLQHLPDENLVRNYIREMLRVLKPAGMCLFQFNGMERPNMNWKGRLAWGVIDGFWLMHLSSISRFVARSFGLDPDMAGKSWNGAAMSRERIIDAVGSAGGTVLQLSGEGTAMAWCCASKTISNAACSETRVRVDSE
ncbi:MAG TPA: methyltransferase domain-containing protein [Candidatus Acidoferrales bacterium]|jgi:SAM-dependent methyltransferase|nr:methyltransferase domain-containing protein [Candidatus Acidoferrales bacterium]